MSIRFITPNQHGVLDFIVATALIVAPFVLGLSPLAVWISAATGPAVIVLGLPGHFSMASSVSWPSLVSS